VLVIAAAATCLLIYEFIVRVDSNADVYAGAAKRTEVSKGLPGGSAGRYKSRTQSSRTLLLGGCRDGRLCVYNWDNGAMDFVTPVSRFYHMARVSINAQMAFFSAVTNVQNVKIFCLQWGKLEIQNDRI